MTFGHNTSSCSGSCSPFSSYREYKRDQSDTNISVVFLNYLAMLEFIRDSVKTSALAMFGQNPSIHSRLIASTSSTNKVIRRNIDTRALVKFGKTFVMSFLIFANTSSTIGYRISSLICAKCVHDRTSPKPCTLTVSLCNVDTSALVMFGH
jgi:hypothetical protein